jgi:hypothetical protein
MAYEWMNKDGERTAPDGRVGVVALGTKEVLLQQRHRCLNKLRALSPVASSLVSELQAIDAAIGGLSSHEPERYAGFRRAIEAITAALTIHDRAIAPQELAADIVAGGWLTKDDRAYFNVMDSIDYHVRRKGHGKKKEVIRMLNGRVGLYEWPDEKFALQQSDNVSG